MLGEQDFDVNEAFTGLESFIRLLYRSPFRRLEKLDGIFTYKVSFNSTHITSTISNCNLENFYNSVSCPVVGDPIDFG
jgi:hypothetical protein